MPAPPFLQRAVQKVASSDRFAALAPKVVPPVDRALSKATGGRLLLSQWIVPSIVLTTTGARSGEPRRSPLAAVPQGDDLYVVASNFGRESHPAWSYNLIRNPRAVVTMHGEDHPVDATLLDEGAKADIWPVLTAQWPPYDRYAQRSGRDLRVFRLSPVH